MLCEHDILVGNCDVCRPCEHGVIVPYRNCEECRDNMCSKCTIRLGRDDFDRRWQELSCFEKLCDRCVSELSGRAEPEMRLLMNAMVNDEGMALKRDQSMR